MDGVNYDTFGKRMQTLALWILCTIALPVFHLVMLWQILFGACKRAHNQAVAYDEAGNAAFGGPPNVTISEHIGEACIQGRKWAAFVRPIVDMFFGKGHCLSNVALPADQLTAEQRNAVNQACIQQGDPPFYPD